MTITPRLPQRTVRPPLASFAAALALSTAPVDGAPPVVSNLTAAQRTGTKLVDIGHSVTADAPTVNVALEIPSDGGATFGVPTITVSGVTYPGSTNAPAMRALHRVLMRTNSESNSEKIKGQPIVSPYSHAIRHE